AEYVRVPICESSGREGTAGLRFRLADFERVSVRHEIELGRIYDVVAKRSSAQCERAAAGRRIRRGHGARDRLVLDQTYEGEKIFGTVDGAAADGDSPHPRTGGNVVCLEYEGARRRCGEGGRVLYLAVTRRSSEHIPLDQIEVAVVDHGDGVIRPAERQRSGAIFGDAIGADPRRRGVLLTVLIEVIFEDVQVPLSVGRENGGLGKRIGGGSDVVGSGPCLLHHILAAQTGIAEAATKGRDAAAAGAAADCEKDA